MDPPQGPLLTLPKSLLGPFVICLRYFGSDREGKIRQCCPIIGSDRFVSDILEHF